jgi:two-component SAPR family response regulator
MKSGPVIIIDDDEDDKDMIEEVLSEMEMSNKTIWFMECTAAFTFLKTTAEQPFIIFCDVNLPGQNGIEFKSDIDNDKELRRKSIPFVFFSNAAEQAVINKVYTQMTVQGYFQKPFGYKETKKILRLVIEYWMVCKHPNTI